MTEHTVKSYGEELNHLTAEVTRMGGLAEAQVADAIDCIARRDAPLAQQVVARDERLDTLQGEIER
jgi:phosphate transport system protein